VVTRRVRGKTPHREIVFRGVFVHFLTFRSKPRRAAGGNWGQGLGAGRLFWRNKPNPQTKPAPGTRTRRWAITSEEETQPAKTVRAGNVVPSRVYNIEPESRAAGFVYFCGAKLGPRLESWISGGMGCTAFRSRIRAGMRYRFLTYLSN
jgi:hypothetical protein